jgi:hypothetical protein
VVMNTCCTHNSACHAMSTYQSPEFTLVTLAAITKQWDVLFAPTDCYTSLRAAPANRHCPIFRQLFAVGRLQVAV